MFYGQQECRSRSAQPGYILVAQGLEVAGLLNSERMLQLLFLLSLAQGDRPSFRFARPSVPIL